MQHDTLLEHLTFAITGVQKRSGRFYTSELMASLAIEAAQMVPSPNEVRKIAPDTLPRREATSA
jgi:hypothetical protein